MKVYNNFMKHFTVFTNYCWSTQEYTNRIWTSRGQNKWHWPCYALSLIKWSCWWCQKPRRSTESCNIKAVFILSRQDVQMSPSGVCRHQRSAIFRMNRAFKQPTFWLGVAGKAQVELITLTVASFQLSVPVVSRHAQCQSSGVDTCRWMQPLLVLLITPVFDKSESLS